VIANVTDLRKDMRAPDLKITGLTIAIARRRCAGSDCGAVADSPGRTGRFAEGQ